jgi:DnaD and phage-associated domain
MEKPSYFSILTADVRYDRRLGKPNARELYSEITALSNKDGYCHASNGYFAKLYEIDNGTVSRWISTLEKCGYLEREIIYYEGTKQVKERRLYPISTPMSRKRNTPPQKKQEGVDSCANTPTLRKRKENNTSINNTSKNKIDRQIAGISKITKFKEFWEKNLGMVAPFILEDFAYEYWDWVDKGVDHDEIIKIFIKALSGAISYGANDKRKYTLGILHNWLNNNILSINAIEGEEKQFKEKLEKKQQQQNSRNYNSYSTQNLGAKERW